MAKRVHGTNGVYVAGNWADIEECDKIFHIKNGSCKENLSSKCAACPRSQSRYRSAKPDDTYDVIIIGAGCIGSSVARELSRSKVSVLVLEAADDVSQGATKGNSGIVHAGFDDVPGSRRAKYCWPGNQMFPKLDSELHFGYQKNGSLVVAVSEEEVKHLQELYERGQKNGVKNLRIVYREELVKMEPHISPNAVAALYSPDAGNLIPYEFAIALAENAADNGVEFRTRRVVKDIKRADGMYTVKAAHWEPSVYLDNQKTSSGRGSSTKVAVTCFSVGFLFLAAGFLKTPKSPQLAVYGAVLVIVGAALLAFASARSSAAIEKGTVGSGGKLVSVPEMHLGGTGSNNYMGGRVVEEETYKGRFIVNAAGTGSDKIAELVGDNHFKVKPRLGEYILLNKNQGHLATATLFPCPTKMGKGVLVQTTLWGNLILGPTARDVHDPATATESYDTVLQSILSKCHSLVPGIDVKQTIHTFSGARAKTSAGDWVLSLIFSCFVYY
jgi:glycerol-3-phosphate dehydrogenase